MDVWLMVEKDKYELPLAVANSAEELAKITGSTEGSIRSFVSKYDNGKIKFSKYRRVRI